jgi:pimeloyl-ACP methyl ester carboxylesterase
MARVRTVGVMWACLGLALSLPLVAGCEFVARSAQHFANERPGRLVTLPDGRRMNLRCSGQGSPTVILESGYGGDSRAWAKVQPRIAKVTHVCAYDRAGYGFSDPGPLPRDGEAIARDLDRALSAADIAGPYIVVGHSAGGLYARLFAARRRGQVKGLVFVDTSVEHQQQRLAAVFGPGAGSLDGVRRRVAGCLQATEAQGKPADAAATTACAPADAPALARKISANPLSWRGQLSELDALFDSTSDEVERVGSLLQDIPAIVLTASRQADGVTATREDPGAAVWQAFHRVLAASFRRGEQRLVKSSHLMMTDRPEVIADAAVELVMRARGTKRPVPPRAAPEAEVKRS